LLRISLRNSVQRRKGTKNPPILAQRYSYIYLVGKIPRSFSHDDIWDSATNSSNHIVY
jgi:hypothetical protein